MTARGLRAFLERLAAQHDPLRAAVAPGLVRFLERAEPFFREQPADPAKPPERPDLEVDRLRGLLHRLAGPVRGAAASGAFLNAWSIAGLGRSELRNAAVLAWFLDPRGSHGLGDAALRAFLNAAAERGGWPAFGGGVARATVQTEEWPLGSETDRVDIAVTGDDFVVFVEVKIGALEGPNQLARYRAAAEEKARILRRGRGHVVYLSPRRPGSEHAGLAVLTWRHVGELLSAHRRDGLGGALAHQFARHVQAFA